MGKQEKAIYTLKSLADFKAVLGVDDREDDLARYCLITSTYKIEQYCKRRLLRKKYFERVEFSGICFSQAGWIFPRTTYLGYDTNRAKVREVRG
jgi:hypothetical protein